MTDINKGDNMMGDDREMYDLVCKEKFCEIQDLVKDNHKEIKKEIKEIITILKGNDRPGLVEQMRQVKKWNKGQVAIISVLLVIIVTEFISWIFTKF